MEDAIKCLEITKADGVSIGRGIMGDFTLPFRIEHYFRTGEIIKEPSLDEKIKCSLSTLKMRLSFGMKLTELSLCENFTDFTYHLLKMLQNTGRFSLHLKHTIR